MFRRIGQAIFVLLVSLFITEPGFAENEGAERGEKNKQIKVKYQKHTEFDFSGSTVKGESRTPEIFYIFQRKATSVPSMVHPPKSLAHQQKRTDHLLKEAFKK